MRGSIYRKSPWATLRSIFAPVVATFVILAIVYTGIVQTDESSRAEGLRILEESIIRAVVKSYAISGNYPESLAYIEENFAIHIDRSRFIVHYIVIASNVFPEITIIELG